MVAGSDPRRGRGIGGYLRVQGTFPRRLVVVVVAGEYHVEASPAPADGGSGGRGTRRRGRSESWWRPRRIGAAGVGGGDLLEVLLVAWRGVCGVQWWCVLEGELRVPFYRLFEAVAMNGDLRRWLRWRSAWLGEIRELGVIV